VIVKIEVGEDAVFFHKEVRDDGTGRFNSKGFAESLLAFDEEVHLRAKSGAGFGLIEISEKGIVFAVEYAARVEAFAKNSCQGGFADANGTFQDDKAGSLRAAMRGASAFGGGRIRTGHDCFRLRASRDKSPSDRKAVNGQIIAESRGRKAREYCSAAQRGAENSVSLMSNSFLENALVRQR